MPAVQSFRASHRLNAEGLSFYHRASDVKYFNLIFFPAVLRTSQNLLLRSGSRGHDTMSEHFTLPGTIVYANFSFMFVDLTLANVLDDRSTIIWCRVPNFPVVSVFHGFLPTSEIYSALLQYEIFSAFTSQGIASSRSRLLPIIYGSDEFLNIVSRASIFKHRQEPRHSWRTFSQPHAVCTLGILPR